MVLQTRSLLLEAILKSAILCFAASISSDLVAVGQFDDARMRRIYASNISKLPKTRIGSSAVGGEVAREEHRWKCEILDGSISDIVEFPYDDLFKGLNC